MEMGKWAFSRNAPTHIGYQKQKEKNEAEQQTELLFLHWRRENTDVISLNEIACELIELNIGGSLSFTKEVFV